jgi:hypothetical protein
MCSTMISRQIARRNSRTRQALPRVEPAYNSVSVKQIKQELLRFLNIHVHDFRENRVPLGLQITAKLASVLLHFEESLAHCRHCCNCNEGMWEPTCIIAAAKTDLWR